MMMQILSRFLSPVIFLSLATVTLLQLPVLPPEQKSLLIQLPYILLAIALVMSVLANQSKELAISVLLIVVYWVIRQFLQTPLSEEPANQIFGITSIFLPVLLLFIVLCPEYGWRHPLGAILVTSPLVALGIGATLLYMDSQWLVNTSSTVALSESPYSLLISANSSTLFLLALISTIIFTTVRNSIIDSCLLGCCVFVFATLAWFNQNHISATLFSFAGLMLVITQIRGLLNLGYKDELTQIGNRRALQKTAKALRGDFIVVMADIDHFKKVNDTHGHDMGDDVLKAIASKLRQVELGGRLYRYGGEEFCLVFKNSDADAVKEELEELRKLISEYDMQVRDKKSRPKKAKEGISKRGASRRKGNFQITISMGMAASKKIGGSFNDVMQAADKALYKAKNSGRNQVKVA
jgi:diguanylate cyclase (GGDEF)-like protein